MTINVDRNSPPHSYSPEKETLLSPRSIPFPEAEKPEEGLKNRSIARRKSIISTQGAGGIKMAFYHGRVERVKQMQAKVTQLKTSKESEEAIALAVKDLAKETESLKQSLQEFIGNIKDLAKIIDDDPHTAIEIINISDTYFKEWGYEAANTILQNCPESTVRKLIRAYLYKEIAETKEPNTLFRFTQTTLGHLVGLFQYKYLHTFLQQRLDQILTKCIFHKKVGTIGRKDFALTFVNQSKAKEQTLRVIKKIKQYLQKNRLPEPLSDMYRTLHAEMEQKYPTLGLGRIASLFFLQGINPAISVGTERFQLGNIKYHPQDEANAIVIAKVMQSIVNNSCPTGELFTEINADFIAHEQGKVEEIARLLINS